MTNSPCQLLLARLATSALVHNVSLLTVHFPPTQKTTLPPPFYSADSPCIGFSNGPPRGSTAVLEIAHSQFSLSPPRLHFSQTLQRSNLGIAHEWLTRFPSARARLSPDCLTSLLRDLYSTSRLLLNGFLGLHFPHGVFWRRKKLEPSKAEKGPTNTPPEHDNFW